MKILLPKIKLEAIWDAWKFLESYFLSTCIYVAILVYSEID